MDPEPVPGRVCEGGRCLLSVDVVVRREGVNCATVHSHE